MAVHSFKNISNFIDSDQHYLTDSPQASLYNTTQLGHLVKLQIYKEVSGPYYLLLLTDRQAYISELIYNEDLKGLILQKAYSTSLKIPFRDNHEEFEKYLRLIKRIGYYGTPEQKAKLSCDKYNGFDYMYPQKAFNKDLTNHPWLHQLNSNQLKMSFLQQGTLELINGRQLLFKIKQQYYPVMISFTLTNNGRTFDPKHDGFPGIDMLMNGQDDFTINSFDWRQINQANPDSVILPHLKLVSDPETFINKTCYGGLPDRLLRVLPDEVQSHLKQLLKAAKQQYDLNNHDKQEKIKEQHEIDNLLAEIPLDHKY